MRDCNRDIRNEFFRYTLHVTHDKEHTEETYNSYRHFMDTLLGEVDEYLEGRPFNELGGEEFEKIIDKEMDRYTDDPDIDHHISRRIAQLLLFYDWLFFRAHYHTNWSEDRLIRLVDGVDRLVALNVERHALEEDTEAIA